MEYIFKKNISFIHNELEFFSEICPYILEIHLNIYPTVGN